VRKGQPIGPRPNVEMGSNATEMGLSELCPTSPRKRTELRQLGMSQRCQKTESRSGYFDHLVGEGSSAGTRYRLVLQVRRNQRFAVRALCHPLNSPGRPRKTRNSMKEPVGVSPDALQLICSPPLGTGDRASGDQARPQRCPCAFREASLKNELSKRQTDTPALAVMVDCFAIVSAVVMIVAFITTIEGFCYRTQDT